MKNFTARLFKREHLLSLLLVLAAILGIFDIPQHLGISEMKIVLALLGILALDHIVEKIGYFDKLEKQISLVDSKLQSSMNVDEFFKTKTEFRPFTYWLKNGDEIWVIGKNLVALISTHDKEIREAASAGKKFRFLLVDPSNKLLMEAMALSSYTLSTIDEMERAGQNAMAQLGRLMDNELKGKVEVRLTNYIPSSVSIIVDGEKSRGQMVVEMYGYKLSSGERLHYYLNRSSEEAIFNYYVNQFNSVWKEAKELPILENKD